jgi:hypothetical protein
MDRMLAVEGGLKTADGELYNEFPDRLTDVLIMALGLTDGTTASERLGWLCAGGAVLSGAHDFRGPMAKPHRRPTGCCTCSAAEPPSEPWKEPPRRRR